MGGDALKHALRTLAIGAVFFGDSLTLSSVYNETLVAALPKDPRIHILDTGAFVTDVLDNPPKYGVTHGANKDACAQPGRDSCRVGEWGEWKGPVADRA